MATSLVIPGLNGSGPDHWQSWLETLIPDSVRVNQDDWGTPNLVIWAERVQEEAERARERVLMIAHSFGCLAAVEVASRRPDLVAALMLVAPADPERFEIGARTSADPLLAPTVVVASTNDAWMSYSGAAHWAAAWDAELINLGAAGHINVASGFGAWPRGYEIFDSLRERTAREKRIAGGASLHRQARHHLAI